jgi:hypothetical protein
VFVDTNGKRMEDIYIQRTDGVVVRPLSVQHAGYYQSASLGVGIGGFANYVGGGVGTGVPVGPKQAQGMSGAFFAAADRAADKPGIGNPPWNVHVKVEKIPPAGIPGVGGPPTAK